MGFPNLAVEWRVSREALRLGLAVPRFAMAPRGKGQPVMLLPGFKAPEATMAPLRRLLRAKGYNAVHWGEGTNQGDVAAYVDRLKPRVTQLSLGHDAPVALVGWSLGGVIARELARDCPELVSTVITYGTPVVGGPVFTATARSYSEDERKRIQTLTHERNTAAPISTPMSIIFSRNDTIVSWPACIDRFSPNTTHYEVDSTHFSMGIDPTVWGIVLEQLAGWEKTES
jgi:triacylglycerol esterase/lipase EstA (alpha/beta hydrolase family)